MNADSLPGLQRPPRSGGFNYFAQPKYVCDSCRKTLPHMIVWGALAMAGVTGLHRFRCPHCQASLQAGKRGPQAGRKR
mgnify:CR=1 FL=1